MRLTKVALMRLILAAPLLLLLSSCSTAPVSLKLNPTATDEARIELAGDTLQCAGMAQQTAVGSIAIATASSTIGVSTLGVATSMTGYPQVACLAVGCSLLIVSTVATASAWYHLFEAGKYQQYSGMILNHTSDAGSCPKIESNMNY